MQVMVALLMALALEPGADPSSMDLLQGARAAMAIGNYEQAITQLTDAKEKDPTNQEIPQLLAEARQKGAASYVATGRKLLSERKYADALVAFDNALDLSPADALAKRGREAAQKWPRAEAYCKSARDYLQKGDFDYAIAYYEKAYELTKDPSIGKWLAAAKAANAKKR